jgi:hypothetical protein
MKRVPWLIVGLLVGYLAGPLFISGTAVIGGHAYERLWASVIGLVIGLLIDVALRWRRR